ncbi:amyloid-beta A4 precursor protein-binding family B member 3 isoform X2 [Phyllopteryx taeniolatus]|uniref:amyloid-beta A4 precursor protein-binding family B member 3 isoform X2 n=1 Tax=Phyllopteryx taeniolatus TaxID=161469 RepID=UPI002AD42262|nr:amyloid-beta A4 precursor protein-binding family B member 3 isoform X2 [Phyllopteryx taeniolatus]
MMGKDYMLAIIIVNCDDNIWSDQNLLLDPDLPSGWKTIQDSTGTYYWHVPTGATQWQHPRLNGTPTQPQPDAQNFFFSGVCSSKDDQRPQGFSAVPADTRSRRADDSCRHDDNSQCFSVRSLGWLQVEEDDLSPGRSSLAVGNVIQQLSRCGPPEERDRPGLLREGSEMRLLLKRDTLTLLDPVDHTPLYCQPIINIRVWGVGSDNGRLMLHVMMMSHNDKVTRSYVAHANVTHDGVTSHDDVTHPMTFPRWRPQTMSQQTSRSLSMDSISPEDLPRQVEFLEAGLQRVHKFDVYYVGNLPVSRAMGMEVLNLAIESIMNSTQRHEWEATVIHVTDNFLSVFKQEGEEPVWACQVRFLSFLGVGHDNRTFAVIVDGGRQRFECHVFWCEPDAGLLSEAVQAACMVQYQKCLVAQTPPPRSRLWHAAAPKVKRANSMDGATFHSGGNGGVSPRKGNGAHGVGVRRGMMAFFDTFRNKQAATS